MAKKTEKTEEEKEGEEAKRAEEARALNVKKTLESKLVQAAAGYGLIYNEPHQYTGQLGYEGAKAFYDSMMAGEEAREIMLRGYYKRVADGKRLRVPGDPSYPTTHEIALDILREVEEVMAIAKLGEIESHVKSLGGQMDDIPEELKNYKAMEIIPKVRLDEHGRPNLDNLDEKEREVFFIYNSLSEAYRRMCAEVASKANFLADLNVPLKHIADKYRKEKEGKKKDEGRG